jgi:haloacetate dehalogenase
MNELFEQGPSPVDRRRWLGQTLGAFAGMTLAHRVGATPRQSRTFFPGFENVRVETSDGVTIHAVVGGQGPPVLLLHGAPQSHITWREVGPRLAEEYTIVAADLRGYGDSSKPPGLSDHSNYSRRVMAQDQVDVMRHLGFDTFALIGQDRGGRVAHRLVLDHPDRVTRVAVMDIVPAHYLYHHVTIEFVQAYFHWFSWLRPAPIPENELIAQYEARARSGAPLSPAQAEYQRTNQNFEGAHAMCEDYRASASIDLIHDAADIDQRIEVPLRVLWAEVGAMDRIYDVLEIWQGRGTRVSGRPMPGGHNMQEGAPDEVFAELRSFLSGSTD